MLAASLKTFLRTTTAVIVPMEDEFDPIVIPEGVFTHTDFDKWVAASQNFVELADTLTAKTVELLTNGHIVPDTLWCEIINVFALPFPDEAVFPPYDWEMKGMTKFLNVTAVLRHGTQEVARGVWLYWETPGHKRAKWDGLAYEAEQTYWKGANPFTDPDVVVMIKSAIGKVGKNWQKPVSYTYAVISADAAIKKQNTDPWRIMVSLEVIKSDEPAHVYHRIGVFRVTMNDAKASSFWDIKYLPEAGSFIPVEEFNPFLEEYETLEPMLLETAIAKALDIEKEKQSFLGSPQIITQVHDSISVHGKFFETEEKTIVLDSLGGFYPTKDGMHPTAQGLQHYMDEIKKIEEQFGKAATFGMLYGGASKSLHAMGANLQQLPKVFFDTELGHNWKAFSKELIPLQYKEPPHHLLGIDLAKDDDSTGIAIVKGHDLLSPDAHKKKIDDVLKEDDKKPKKPFSKWTLSETDAQIKFLHEEADNHDGVFWQKPASYIDQYIKPDVQIKIEPLPDKKGTKIIASTFDQMMNKALNQKIAVQETGKPMIVAMQIPKKEEEK